MNGPAGDFDHVLAEPEIVIIEVQGKRIAHDRRKRDAIYRDCEFLNTTGPHA